MRRPLTNGLKTGRHGRFADKGEFSADYCGLGQRPAIDEDLRDERRSSRFAVRAESPRSLDTGGLPCRAHDGASSRQDAPF